MAIESINSSIVPAVNTFSGVVRTDNKAQEVTVSGSNNTNGVTMGTNGNVGKQSNTQEDKQQKSDANSKRMKSILDDTNNKMKGTRRRCEFSYHEDINRVSIKVVDEETNEVIKEIPPEETLDMIQKIWEVAGLLVDEKR